MLDVFVPLAFLAFSVVSAKSAQDSVEITERGIYIYRPVLTTTSRLRTRSRLRKNESV